MPLRFAFVFVLFALLSACSNAPPRGLASPSSPSTPISAPPASPAQPSTRYYKDDGPGESVVVRVNDRGPFLHDRIIDLSYAAANKLGIAQSGSGLVEVEAIIPADLLLADASPPLSPVTVTEASAPSLAPDIPLSVAPGGFSVQLGAFANY